MTLPLLDYQLAGAAYLSRETRAGLFDAMGVGKTAQAIHACDLVKAGRIIVVCPAAVREVWVGEFKKFSPFRRRILKGRDIQDLNLWMRGRADVFLLSYEMATKWAKRLEGDLIDVIIFDEGHYIKSPGAQRTRAMLGAKCDGLHGLARWAAYAWFLTGTPAPNEPIDLWPFLRFTGATTLPLRHFTDRYFKIRPTAYGQQLSPRDEMMPELQQAIRSRSLRRTKSEAGLKLPPIWLTTTTVDGDTHEIKALLRQHEGLERAILEAIERGGLSFLDANHIMTLRRLVGEAKAPAFVNLIAEELANGLDKIVIYGVHKRALQHVRDGLTKRGFGCVHIDGAVSERDRVSAVREFQSNPGVHAFIGNIRAAGTGITLIAAADIVLMESDWSPAGNAQALNRVHRIGQEKQVRARFITLANSIDETVNETLARKTSAILKVGFSDGVS